MKQKNEWMHAARLAAGGKLHDGKTAAEDAFKKFWEGVVDKSVYKEAYSEWDGRSKKELVARPDKPYMLSWGGGCQATPITKEEFTNFVNENGWPKNETIDDLQMTELKVAPDRSIEFDGEGVDQFNLWGLGRAARNPSREDVAPWATWEVIEKGVVHYIEHCGRKLSDSGTLMLMVQGNAKNSRDITRSVVNVSGTIYSPKVFDVHMSPFVNDAHRIASPLPLPCDVRIGLRQCRVTNNFECMDSRGSDEWIKELLTSFENMRLFHVDYDVVAQDGSILWSRINGAKDVGELWVPGKTVPLTFGAAADEGSRNRGRRHAHQQSVLEKRLDGDPFSEEAHARVLEAQAARGRGRAPGRAGRGRGGGPGRGRGRGPGVGGALDVVAPLVLDGALGDPAPPPPAAPRPPVHVIYEGGLDEDDDAISTSSSMRELEEEFDPERFPGDEPPRRGDVDPDPVVESRVGAALVVAGPELGLDDGANGVEDDAGAHASGSAGSLGAGGSGPPVPAVVRDPWDNFPDEPSGLGYYYMDNRSVLRVVRGNPAGKVSVSCYRHRGCKCLIPLRHDPGNYELKKWLFAVEATLPDDNRDRNARLVAAHKAEARTKFGAI